MLNPKQNLTSFARVYQAKAALPQGAEMMFGAFAAALAKDDTVHEYDASVLSQLPQAQSITCVEEVAALARIDELKGTKFIKDLGIQEDLSHRMIESLKKLNPNVLSDMERFEKLEYTLGCELDFSTPPPSVNLLQPTVVAGMTFGAPPPSGGQPPPPATVNLIDSHMPPIRDQGDRGTCVAFTSMACLEYHLDRFGSQPGLDLSEQFQYWNMVTTTNQRNLVSSYPLLGSAGSCREVTWPYYGKEMAGNDTQGPVPAAAAGEAAAFRCNQVRQVAARDVSAIQEELRRERLVGI